MNTINEAMEFINSYSKLGEKVTDLSRIAELLDTIGNPQDYLKFVHIAGTNGKGSVLELCSTACINSKYRVGQFTSPFVQEYADRIRINGENIPETKLIRVCDIVKNTIKKKAYSQFKITFAIALLYFLNQNCDIVFLETGIGGLLDATNIIKNPVASVITTVSYDHTAILGDTLEKIAMQKAGIIKENRPAIISYNNPDEVMAVIRAVAESKNSKLIIPDKDLLVALNMSLNGSSFVYKSNEYTLKMAGKHQIVNATTAIETIEILRKSGFEIPLSAVQKAFSEVQVRARAEIINRNPLVILDGGHNEGGISSLEDVVSMVDEKPIIALTGMIKTKDYKTVASKLSEYADMVICVDDFADNAVPAQELAGYMKKCRVRTANSTNEGMYMAMKLAMETKGSVIICGSLYLATNIMNSQNNIF